LWPAGVGDDDVVGHPAREDAAGKPGRRDQRDQRRCHCQHSSGRDQRRALWIVDVGDLNEGRILCRPSVLPSDRCFRCLVLGCFTLPLDAGGGLCVSACGFDAFALDACGFCVSTFGLYAFPLDARRFRLTAFRFRAFPLDELGIRSPAFGVQALPLDLCGFRSTTFGLNALLLEARGFRLSLCCFYALMLDSCGLRFAAPGLYALPLDACRFGFPSRGLRAFPLELLALGAQFRKRATDQIVRRTKLFQARERGSPSTSLEVPAGLLNGLARQIFVRDRRQREHSVENRFELRMFTGLLP
jgi:hypothetical protein